MVGMKDRNTKQVKTEVIDHPNKPTLQGFIHENTEMDAQVCTDEWASYKGINRHHEIVRHSAKEYVYGMAHTNGMESHWAMMKRGYTGVYHQWSVKHLPRYVNEFAGRHNSRPSNTAEQMATMVHGMGGKRLRYEDLIA